MICKEVTELEKISKLSLLGSGLLPATLLTFRWYKLLNSQQSTCRLLQLYNIIKTVLHIEGHWEALCGDIYS